MRLHTDKTKLARQQRQLLRLVTWYMFQSLSYDRLRGLWIVRTPGAKIAEGVDLPEVVDEALQILELSDRVPPARSLGGTAGGGKKKGGGHL